MLFSIFIYFQLEQASHQKTRNLLKQEREKAKHADAELLLLKKQLQRERTTFENALVDTF